MPQIIIKGASKQEVNKLAIQTAPKLGEICACPSDWFVFEHNDVTYFDQTGEIKHWPVVQTWWFARPQDVQDKVATLLNDTFKEFGYTGAQISFHIFEGEAYYEDGTHY